MPYEGLMVMVGVWGQIWFVCRGVVSGVKRVHGGTGHVHSPRVGEKVESNRKHLAEGLTRRWMKAFWPRGKI